MLQGSESPLVVSTNRLSAESLQLSLLLDIASSKLVLFGGIIEIAFEVTV